jgi:DNA-3-methyladenine glycosylase
MLEREFFQRDPVTCARELIGCELVWKSCAGIVVETEAYSVVGDEACHTFARPSARAFIAAHHPGAAYVYFNYGMYWLFNVLVKGGTEDGFVLIRALEPTRSISGMQKRRFAAGKPHRPEMLCSGPGRLTIALGIDGRDHGRDLCQSARFGFRASGGVEIVRWVSDARVGISKARHLPWRFLAAENSFVSTRSASARKQHRPSSL